jgi:Protein of unknown function (DUF3347)
MKKWLILVVILVLGTFTAYKLLVKKDDLPPAEKESPLSISKNSDAFNLSFGKVMSDYYSLKDAFVGWDTIQINTAAKALGRSVDGLQLKELKADTMIVETAANLASGISNELKGLEEENTIEQKRRGLNMVTDELYSLIRTVRYDRERIYHMKCPMAFSDSSEAYWLSNISKVVNPYLGKNHPIYKDKMLGCGEITDSLDFSTAK